MHPEVPLDEETQRLHEWDAETYHRSSDPQFELAMVLLDTCPLAGDETVVDAGCGSGRVTEKILERLPEGKVIAVDRSRNMLDLAEHILVPRFGPQIELVQADMQTFCLDREADVVFSNMALHFVADHGTLFQNLYATLRPGGYLAVQFGASTQSQSAETQALLRDVLASAPFGAYLGNWQPDFIGGEAAATRTFLEAAGFCDVDVREASTDPQLAGRAQVDEFLRTILLRQALMKLPDDGLRDALVGQASEALIRSGALRRPWAYVVARGRVAEAV
ncbi:MAG TPA: methyltransferase domain-containing protein [Myxococcota bacterium]|nr:methyltransferase domain-containing protein [Myxococcota bacterium]